MPRIVNAGPSQGTRQSFDLCFGNLILSLISMIMIQADKTGKISISKLETTIKVSSRICKKHHNLHMIIWLSFVIYSLQSTDNLWMNRALDSSTGVQAECRHSKISQGSRQGQIGLHWIWRVQNCSPVRKWKLTETTITSAMLNCNKSGWVPHSQTKLILRLETTGLAWGFRGWNKH